MTEKHYFWIPFAMVMEQEGALFWAKITFLDPKIATLNQ